MSNDLLVEGDTGNWVLDNNNTLLIYIPTYLDANEAVSFRRAFECFCESAQPPSKATLDFSRTRFLDSGGIGALANIIKMSKINGIELTVSKITTLVYSVLKMTKLDSLLRIDITEVVVHESVIEALG